MAYCLRTVTDNCTAIVFSLAILLSGLRATYGAPVGEEEWWMNPCNKQPALRHSRSAAENQLKRFMVEMNKKFYKDILDMYKPIDKSSVKGSCPRINNLLKPIQKAENFTTAMHAFYETLLQFAQFIDRLKSIPIETKGDFDNDRRQRIFEEAKGNLRLLICEYNDTLSNKNHRNNHKKELVGQQSAIKINMKCLPKVMDSTQAHLNDVFFFQQLEKFLKRSRRLIKKKKRPGKKLPKKNNKQTKKRRHHK